MIRNMNYGSKSLTNFGLQKKKFHNPTDEFHSLSLNHKPVSYLNLINNVCLPVLDLNLQ